MSKNSKIEEPFFNNLNKNTEYVNKCTYCRCCVDPGGARPVILTCSTHQAIRPQQPQQHQPPQPRDTQGNSGSDQPLPPS